MINKLLFFQKQSEKNIGNILTQSIKLLTKCILPLNKLGIYHMDLKSNNMLVKKKKIFIIDWGLADIDPTIESFSKESKFIFNFPFGNIVFGRMFNYFCKFKIPIEEARQNVRLFLKYYEEDKQIKLIKTIMTLLNKNYLECIENYLVNIITNYTKEEYFKIFLYNVDIWGFVCIFIDILEIFNQYRNILTLLFDYIYTCTGYLDTRIIIQYIEKLIKQMKKNTSRNTKRKRSTITDTSRFKNTTRNNKY